MSSGVFRVSNQRFHLTYKTHLNFNDWLVWAKNKIKKIEEYSMVHETGDEHHPYPHSHIYVNFEKRIDSRRADIFNFKLDEFNDYWHDSFWESYRENKDEMNTGIHPEITPVTKDQHREHLINVYHKKEGIPFTNIISEEKASCRKCNKEKHAKKHTCGIIEYVEEKAKPKKLGLKELQENFAHNPFEAISFYAGDDISKISAVQRAIPYIRKVIGEEPKVLWRPWHMDVLEFLSGMAGDRLILFIVDLRFNSGKSSFCEHLEMYYKVKFLQMLTLSSVSYDIRKDFEKSGRPIKNILIDLPKGYKMPEEGYNTLEYLKNGKITSEKYDSGKVNFTGSANGRPHVIVFTNEEPDYDKLSLDKIGVWILDNFGVYVKEKDVVEFPEIKLPPGYQKPGTVIEVAKPDEIVDESGLKDFKFDKFTKEEREYSLKFWTDYESSIDRAKMEKTKNDRKKKSQTAKIRAIIK